MDASENLRGYAGDPSHSLHSDPYNNSIITPGSYTFMTGALEAPLKDQTGGSLLQGAAEDGVEPQSSTTTGSLIGTLFTNHQLPGSFNSNNNSASRTPPSLGNNNSNSWELTINGGAAGSLYAGGSNVSMPNILINGSGLNASTPTAQLLIGGLQGGSFNDQNDHGGVYYPPSQGHNAHAEAMQLIYVNGGYNAHHNAFQPDGRGATNATTIVYPNPQDAAENNTNSTSYGVSIITPGNISQRALEAAAAIPLVTLNQERHGQSFNNWQRAGGNEHSFLPVNEEPPSHHSLFGAALGRHGGDQGHELSHMHGGDQHGMHVETLSQGGNNNNNISVNGQGLLSLSLSSHQPHFQGGHLAGESTSEAHMVAQAAAMAKTKELASRYIASGANADLSRFRTPSRDDVMAARFHHENHGHVGHSAHRKLAAAGPSGSTSGALSASQFLQSVQSILNELCKVTPLKRVLKPANSSEQQSGQQYPLRNSSVGYGFHGKEDSHSAMHAETNTVRGDPGSSVGSLSDASHIVTVSHIPLQAGLQAEMMSEAARASGTSRDDLDFKKGQLIRMLEEVEARFRRYSDQLQVTCAGFNAQAGPNAATPYTILALQAMSRHFRCLKDAVKNQLKVVRRALGEEDVPAGYNGETSRLRYVDQQIRQQRALQQLGMLQQHAWRPQRGLPERAVSVLRAWLFEHFLHPYPKDVDKMSLAKQTGLTRSQVSNWFINARVRLWKPMVEEMYVEEQREAADIVMQGERMAREQANLHNNPYEHYEANNSNNNNNNSSSSRGRTNATLQDEMNANCQQHSSLPSDYRTTAGDEGCRDQDHVGPSVNNMSEVQQAQVLYRQQDMAAGEHNFSYENARESKRSKTALETVSDAFNNTTSMMLMHSEGDNSGRQLPNSASSPEDDNDMDARKMKGKSVAAEQEQEQEAYHVSAGAFVSYNDGSNSLSHVHRYHDSVAGYVSSRGAATASTGVSLTLGLRHCDANMRTAAVSVAPMLEKYDMDVEVARMDPLDREGFLHEGRLRDVHDNGQYDMQRDPQEEENNHSGSLTRETLSGGTGMTSQQAFEHHHEFHDGH